MEKGSLLAMKSTDRKDTYLLRTTHDGSCQTVSVWAKPTLNKPCILQYSKYMRAVDLSD